ncbi:unnamed protein product [Tilletia laevis]|uniref:Oxidoreductase AflY n=3 Tax=Tilletia TaxID=13289 RepID=A0A8X7ML98_9BASI|nr:hypothetical protein CF336_g8046 [Tilletia laevis]KAE8240267.1 hypothetical protein A4X06_0g7839 [Tilletia controversa]KAE8244358.1 hypothetical protein A4X03_0g7563 [Tilletia caries]KAE8186402.1 hypothetical protein CF335_g7455 [Tilletia laevis]CAD6892853.1 unnamed protein product [Tilletia caries]
MTAASPIQPRKLTAPHASSLRMFPGFTPPEAQAATRVLQQNHDDFHVFFNMSGFHNHLAHHVLAALALGAPAQHYPKLWNHALLNDLDPSFRLNKKPSHEGYTPITRATWKESLNKYTAYWAYLAFFEDEIAQNGVGETLERFLFSDDALSAPAHMLVRLFDGALHPFIHVGYGVEFGFDGIVAEGLAMAAITGASSTSLYPEGWFNRCHQEEDQPKEATSQQPTASSPRAGLSLFTLFAQIGADPSLAPGTATKWEDDSKFAATLRSSGSKIAAHMEKWLTTPADVEADVEAWGLKVSELVWVNTLLLGATTPPSQPSIKHDFFLMHAHNATLFLPAIFNALSDKLSGKSRALLLHGLARTTVFTWIARGRPVFYLKERLMKTEATPYHPDHRGLNRTERVAQKASGEEEKGEDENKEELARPSPWYDVVSAASIHFDEHLVKAVRTQAYFSSWLAGTPAGTLHLQEEQGEGKEETVWKGELGEVDGTTFLRTAGQMMKSQTWDADLKRQMRWTQQAIGFEQAWR